MPPDSGTLPFRIDQLTFRRQEIHLAYSAFRSLTEYGYKKVEQETPQLQTIDGSHIDWDSWFKRVKCEADVTLAGHSFGGATVVSCCIFCYNNVILTFSFVKVFHAIEPASRE